MFAPRTVPLMRRRLALRPLADPSRLREFNVAWLHPAHPRTSALVPYIVR
ncbi:MAG: hypothetical protein WD749_09585 [Phycisphaerales bacterium]